MIIIVGLTENFTATSKEYNNSFSLSSALLPQLCLAQVASMGIHRYCQFTRRSVPILFTTGTIGLVMPQCEWRSSPLHVQNPCCLTFVPFPQFASAGLVFFLLCIASVPIIQYPFINKKHHSFVKTSCIWLLQSSLISESSAILFTLTITQNHLVSLQTHPQVLSYLWSPDTRYLPWFYPGMV